MKLIKHPFEPVFTSYLSKTKKEIIISSPYVNQSGIQCLIDNTKNSKDIDILLLTNLSFNNIFENVTQPAAILRLHHIFKTVKVISLEKLHAKVYIFDEKKAIVISSNLTKGGLKENFEYGVLLDQIQKVKSIKYDILQYTNLGSEIDKNTILLLNEESKKLLKAQKMINLDKLGKNIPTIVKKASETINESLLLNKFSNGKTINSIFSETLIYILKYLGPMSTNEIHKIVKEIHPELCDDRYDRVINGQHFGKFWKHAVRNAQASLKKRNIITLRTIDKKSKWFYNEL